MKTDGDDYEVGYGKPPKETQFKKDQSGNKKGRPKGSRNFNTDLEETLNAPMTVTENGNSKTVTTQLAVLYRLREKALKGDARALDRALSFAQQLSEEKAAHSSERKLTSDEDDILERFKAECIADAVAKGEISDDK